MKRSKIIERLTENGENKNKHIAPADLNKEQEIHIH